MQQLDLMIAFQAGQTLFGLLLAMLLTVFLFEFRHRFLKHWAFSCLALACHFGSSALMMLMFHSSGLEGTILLVLNGFSLAAAYLHVLWLMIGTWEAVNERNISGRIHLLLITLSIVVGVVSAWLHSSGILPDWMAGLLAESLLFIVTGIAFIVAAIMLWRTLNPQRMLSSRLTPLAFIAYGLYMLYVGGLNSWINLNNTPVAHAPYLGIVGFLLLILIGYSIIIWLLEIERRRSVSAWEKAQSAERRLIHLRRHDAATGLPNRRQLQDQLFHEVRAAAIRRNRVGVLSIGIHRFNLVSQALGWNKTDELIRRLARRLQKFSPKNSTLGRVGDRDFLLILPDAGRREKTLALARWILTESATPLTEEGKELYLSLSGGLCFAPDDDIDPPALIKMAQQAQLRASERGETLVVHRASPGDSQPHDLLDLERELRTGVHEGQFCLYFQPLVSLRERRITGFETLLRWNHPERGVLTPGSFLQEAERLGVLDELEDQILDQALGQMREWQNEVALPQLSVSINLSAQRFQQADLADKLASLCKQHEVDPHNLHVEITESTAMDDFDSGLNTIAALRKLGCKVCLDDFGTGYSSLAHLRRLQVDYVKLDRSFLSNLDRDPQERDLTRAIVDLIHSLNMTVLAEGVETRQQLGHMIQCRVDVIQGFLLGRPEPASHFRSVLENPQLVIA